MTHTGKELYGYNGAKSTADRILLEQKGPESLENQGPEGSRSVGEDEIGSSNLPSSSKRNPGTVVVLGFSFLQGRETIEKAQHQVLISGPTRVTLPDLFVRLGTASILRDLPRSLEPVLIDMSIHHERR